MRYRYFNDILKMTRKLRSDISSNDILRTDSDIWTKKWRVKPLDHIITSSPSGHGSLEAEELNCWAFQVPSHLTCWRYTFGRVPPVLDHQIRPSFVSLPHKARLAVRSEGDWATHWYNLWWWRDRRCWHPRPCSCFWKPSYPHGLFQAPYIFLMIMQIFT